MTRDEIKSVFLKELCRVAPDIEPDDVSEDDHLLDDLDLDSMDVLNLVTALQSRFGVSVPEIDYPRLETIKKAVDYLGAKLA